MKSDEQILKEGKIVAIEFEYSLLNDKKHMVNVKYAYAKGYHACRRDMLAEIEKYKKQIAIIVEDRDKDEIIETNY